MHRAIIENMAKVRIARTAPDFDPAHPERPVFQPRDTGIRVFSVECRPAAAGCVLHLGGEQQVPTADAMVVACSVLEVEFTGVRPFCPGLPSHVVLSLIHI